MEESKEQKKTEGGQEQKSVSPQDMCGVIVKPLSKNPVKAAFQCVRRKWLGAWYDFKDKHEKAAGILYKVFFFLVFSIGVTVWQYIVMTFLPYAFASLDNGPWGYPNIPLAAAGGVPYVIFGDAKGLGYFISFEIAVFTAQCINFPLQRNLTYKSHGNPWFQAMWYFIGWAVVSVAASALWGVVNCFFTYLQVPDAVSGMVKTLMTGLITLVIFFFIFMIIFPDRRKQAVNARKKYDRLVKRKVEGERLDAALKRAEELERKADYESARSAYSSAEAAADAKAIAWDEAVKKLEKLTAKGADEKALSGQRGLIERRFALAVEAVKKRDEAKELFARTPKA